jgi:hypothetical protein
MTAYGFALAFFYVVLWAEEVATVILWLAAAAIVVVGSLWIYHNPSGALDALGILALFTWPIILAWAIYLSLCWWHGVKPRAPCKPWVPLKQKEPWRGSGGPPLEQLRTRYGVCSSARSCRLKRLH